MNLFEQAEQEKATPSNTQRRLNKVIIQNYRNISYKEYDLDGKSLLLESKNGLGKTNVIESIFWALSGNLFDGTAKTESQEIIPEKAENDIVTSVKLEFDYNLFTFERTISQEYDKDGTYKGMKTKLIVNGAPSKNIGTAMSALENYLGFENISNRFSASPELAKLNIFELIYNLNALKSLDYKIIRSIIIDMVGDIDYKKIISDNQTKYHKLIEPLKSHGSDLVALKTATFNKIHDKRDGLESTIETTKGIIKQYETDAEKVASEEEIKTAKVEIEKIDKEIDDLKKQLNANTTDQKKEISNQITALQNKIYERQNELRTEYQTKLAKFNNNDTNKQLEKKKNSFNDLREQRITLNEKISNKENEISKNNATLSSKKSALETANLELADLKKKWKELKNPEPIGHIYTCPNCNHKFDLSETKEYREIEIAKIDELGKAKKNEVSGLEEGIESLLETIEIQTNMLNGFVKERNQLNKNISDMELEINNLNAKIADEDSLKPALDLLNDKDILDYTEKINALTRQRTTLTTNSEEHDRNIKSSISDLELKKEPYQKIVQSEITANSYRENAQKLRKDLKKLQNTLMEKQDITTLIKELEKDMYDQLDKRIVNIFGDNLYFKLWKLNISNGEYDTRMCDIFVKDDFGRFVNLKVSLNSGLRPFRMIEIISKIKEFYQIPKSFIFIDELGDLDTEHVAMLSKFDEQILATRPSDSTTIQEVRI